MLDNVYALELVPTLMLYSRLKPPPSRNFRNPLSFLLGAMTIVELIDAHDGFDIITEKITTTNKRYLLIIVSAYSLCIISRIR
jgi:hypothetical protein